MGRRNINTTKSGKYMNPTDQARKEARKKELKKNKRQRQMVRAAVLKGKDPTQLIIEMEKMDQMEYNVEIPPALSEKVLKDKRKKLRETLDRVLKLYEKENPEYWVEIRRMVADYEKKRQTLIEYYEAVKHAQAVTVDEIPLPNFDMPSVVEDGMEYEGMEMTETTSAHTLDNEHDVIEPAIAAMTPQSILKKQLTEQQETEEEEEQLTAITEKLPPGCPPTLPPDLSDDEDLNIEEPMDADDDLPKQKKLRFQDEQDQTALSDDEKKESDGEHDKNYESDEENYSSSRSNPPSNENRNSQKTKGLTSLQAKLLKLSGQDVDQFVRETEVLLQEKEADRRADLKERLSKLKDKDQPNITRTSSQPESKSSATPVISSTKITNTTAPAESADPAVSSLPVNTRVAAAVGNVGVPDTTTVAPPPISYNIAPVGVPPPLAPPVAMFPPPLPRPGMPPMPPIGVRLPPGPPPQNLAHLLPLGMTRLPNMRLPPPMRPPGMVAPPGVMPRAAPPIPAAAAPNVLTAAPQLLPRPNTIGSNAPTIQAKPQIRSLSADITRFLPTALRVKREDKKKITKTEGKDAASRVEEMDKKPTKDDAYSQFMKEMEDLL
uniref:WW domain-binding protein 11-like n=2 Tax=Hirondellea gigas TaxID=1518452 RepID=A0A2P2I0L2_9CRUS